MPNPTAARDPPFIPQVKCEKHRMLYRETGQFKTNYADDMAVFPIRQDRIALWLFLIVAFVGVPVLDALNIWPFAGEYLLRAILIPFLILALGAVGLNILT